MNASYTLIVGLAALTVAGFHSRATATDLPKGKAMSCRIETVIGDPVQFAKGRQA